MGGFPHQRPPATHPDPAAALAAGGARGDAADAAFEALRAGAGSPPLTDAAFESLLARLKGLEGQPSPSRSSASPAAGRPLMQDDRGDPVRWREAVQGVAEELAQLYRKLAQAPEAGALRPPWLEELACLVTNLHILLHQGEPHAVLVATAAGGWRFALPLAGVETVRSAQEPLPQEGWVVIDPRRWWEGGSQDVAASDTARYWVIVTAGPRRQAALAVCALHGVCRAPASAPGPMLAASRPIAGIVRDAEGNAAVLVRLEELLAGEDTPADRADRAPAAGP